MSTKNQLPLHKKNRVEFRDKHYFWQEKKCERCKEFLSSPCNFDSAYSTLSPDRCSKYWQIIQLIIPK